MSNIIDFPRQEFKDKIESMDRTDIVAVLRIAFGVDATLLKVTNEDNPEEPVVYGAKIEVAEEGPPGLLFDDVDAAVNTWHHCYEDALFDTSEGVIMCFISCMLDGPLADALDDMD